MTSTLRPRTRRTKNELQQILDATRAIIKEEAMRVTIRHLFYRLVSLNLVQKSERAYRNLCALLARWRRREQLPWTAFADNTRWHLGKATHNSLHEMLISTAATYRRNLWASSKTYLEIWTEKDAIAGILLEAADPFGVPVFPLKGFASLTSLHGAAETFRKQIEQGKEARITYFGDHDPSGRCIDMKAEATLRDDFGVDVSFERKAVTQEQIAEYGLPTRPTKKSDSRARGFVGESVEIDALSPKLLRAMVEETITAHIDKGEYERLKATEKQERNSFLNAMAGFPKGTDPFEHARFLSEALDNFV